MELIQKLHPSACVTVSIDSTSAGKLWPRTVTLTYGCKDTINGETFTQSGAVTIQVDTVIISKKRFYSRLSHLPITLLQPIALRWLSMVGENLALYREQQHWCHRQILDWNLKIQ